MVSCDVCGHLQGKYHELKTWPYYFREVQSGRKAFELRKNDRNFERGDILCLKEYDPEKDTYSGAEVLREVVSVLYKFPGLEDGYVIMGLLPA